MNTPIADLLGFTPDGDLADAVEFDQDDFTEHATVVDVNCMLSRELMSVVVDPMAMQLDCIQGFGSVADHVVASERGICVDFDGTDLPPHAIAAFSAELVGPGEVHPRLLDGEVCACLLRAAKAHVVQGLSPTSTLRAFARVVSTFNGLVALLTCMVGAPSLAQVLNHDSTIIALCDAATRLEPPAIVDVTACLTAMNVLKFVNNGVFLSSKGVQTTNACTQIAKTWNEVLQRALFQSRDTSLIAQITAALVATASFVFLTPNAACAAQPFSPAGTLLPGHLEALLHPNCARHHAGASRVLAALGDESTNNCPGEFPLAFHDLMEAATKYPLPGAPLTPADHLHLLPPQILCHAAQLALSDRAVSLKVVGMLMDRANDDLLCAGDDSLGVVLRKIVCEDDNATWTDVVHKLIEPPSGVDGQCDIGAFLIGQLGTELARVALHLSQHVAAHEATASVETIIRFCIEMNDFVWSRLVTAAAKQESHVPLSDADVATADAATCAVDGMLAIWDAGIAHQNGTVSFAREERQAFLRPFDVERLTCAARFLPAAPTAASAMTDKIIVGCHLTGVSPDSTACAFEYFVKAPSVLGSRGAVHTRRSTPRVVTDARPRPKENTTLAIAPSNTDAHVLAQRELTTCIHDTANVRVGCKRPLPPKALTAGTAKAHVYLRGMEAEILDASKILAFGKRCIDGGTHSSEESLSVLAFRKFQNEIEFRQSASAKKEGGFSAKTQLDQAFSVFNKSRWQRCTGCIGDDFCASDLFPGMTQAYLSSVESAEECSKLAAAWGISEQSVRTAHLGGDFDHAFGTFHTTPDKQTHMAHGWSVVRALRRKMRGHNLYSYHKNIVSCLTDSGWEEPFALALCMRGPGGTPFNTKDCSSTHAERYYTMNGALAFMDCVLSTGSSSTFPLMSPPLPQPGKAGECGEPLGKQKKRKVSNDPADDDDAPPARRPSKITSDTRPCKNRAPNCVDQLLFMRNIHTMVVPIAIDSLGGIVILAGITCLTSEHAFHTMSGLLPLFMVCDIHRADAATEELTRLTRAAFSSVAAGICCGRVPVKTTFCANPATGATDIQTSSERLSVDPVNFNNPIGYSYLLASVACMFDPSAVKVTERDVSDKAARGRTSRVNPFQAIVNAFTGMACSTMLDFGPDDMHIDTSMLSAAMRGRYHEVFGKENTVTGASLVPHVRDFMGCVDGSRLADGEYLFATQTAFAIYRVIVLKQTDFKMPKNFGAFASTLQHRQSVRSIVADMMVSQRRARQTQCPQLAD